MEEELPRKFPRLDSYRKCMNVLFHRLTVLEDAVVRCKYPLPPRTSKEFIESALTVNSLNVLLELIRYCCAYISIQSLIRDRHSKMLEAGKMDAFLQQLPFTLFPGKEIDGLRGTLRDLETTLRVSLLVSMMRYNANDRGLIHNFC